MIGGRVLLRAAVVFALGALAACGKKGPPLPPLHIVPDAVTDVSARRLGNEVRIRFVLPVKNLNGPAPVDLDRIEIYAATVAPGAVTPPNRELLSSKFIVGKIPTRPPAEEGKPQAPDDSRPGPGETATFVEELTEATTTPQFTVMPPVPVAGATQEAPAPAGATAPAPPPPPVATRIYVIRGIARNGRPGQPAGRIPLPLVPPPEPPSAMKVDFTAAAVTLTWFPPVAEAEAKSPLFNVYASDLATPLNQAPLDSPAFERAGVTFDKEECFVVRTVARFAAVTVESAATQPACVTPKDIFPPADPTGLSVVASDGGISLIWDANTEADLAGYLVLRAEAPGDTLQAITPAPLTETTFRDTTVRPGVRYIYAVVAVDRATPPNVSGQSRRMEETAR